MWTGFFFTFVGIMKWILILLFATSTAFAQIPGFEIYTMYIGGNATEGYYYTEPQNISNFKGYDNQPAFSPDNNRILFTSMRENAQADIYEYDFRKGTLSKFTSTPESEYSPEYAPDGKTVTMVRVAMDTSQRLWNYNPKKQKFKPLIKNITGVGYYCRINADVVALFLLPEPFTLRMAKISEPLSVDIDRNIGRSIKMIPDEFAFSYISKEDTTYNLVKRFDINRNKITAITRVPRECEDMAWSADGKLFMAKGGSIFYYDYGKTNRWYLFADMQSLGINQINRIAFSPDQTKMAFVAAE